MEILQSLLVPFQHPILLLWIFVGVFAGMYVGAIPGLSGAMAISLLVSFTYTWETDAAIAIMIGIHVGACYGGSRSAILLNIPGAAAAVATTFDGYPLAQKGQAAKAIGVTVVQSVIGGVIGAIALAVFAPVLSKFALKFAPRDYALLAIMGLLLIGGLSGKSFAKGIFAGLLGLLLGVIGMDSATASYRFTFGSRKLIGGVNYVVAMIGLFGFAEALVQMRTIRDDYTVQQVTDKIRPSLKETLHYLPLTIQTSILGVIVGALPGTGGDIAALFAYDYAKRVTPHPETPFGEGAVEGLVAPESANNAAVGGAYIPMLTLGIPGDAGAALILGALFIHGLQPGPNFMKESPGVVGVIVGGMLVAQVFLLICGFTGIKLFTKIVEIPKFVLMPMVMVLSVIGAYAINNNLTDVYWMVAFGVIGYFMRMHDFPVGGTILGIILSQMLEKNIRRTWAISIHDLGNVAKGFWQSPLSMVLLGLIIVMTFMQTPAYKKLINRRKKNMEK